MRMWMVDPRRMCSQHLLGEHVELHMLAAWITSGKRIDGWALSNCLQPSAIGKRHAQLVREMGRRGYNHKSPLVQPPVQPHQFPGWAVDRVAALAELQRRCAACRAL